MSLAEASLNAFPRYRLLAHCHLIVVVLTQEVGLCCRGAKGFAARPKETDVLSSSAERCIPRGCNGFISQLLLHCF